MAGSVIASKEQTRTSGSRRSVPREKCLTLRKINTHVGCISEKHFCVAKGSVEQDSTSHRNRDGVGDGSLFKALDELCLNRTVHPSISLSHHRCCWNKSVGDACMHDDRLCEERKKRCFRADLTVIPPSPVLLFAIKAEVARWKKCDPLDCAPTPSTLAQSRERKGSKFAA